MLSVIQNGNRHAALQAFRNIYKIWFWSNKGFGPFFWNTYTNLINSGNPHEEAFIKLIGIDILREAEILLITHPHFLERFRLSPNERSAINQELQTFEHKCRGIQKFGSRNNLELLREQLRTKIIASSPKPFRNSKCLVDNHFHVIDGRKLAIVEALLDAPLTQIISSIASSNFSIAQEAQKHMKGQIADHLTAQNVKTRDEARESLVETEGCDLLTIADTLIEIHPNNPRGPSTPLNQMLSVIQNGPAADACGALQQLTNQTMMHCAEQGRQTIADVNQYLLTAEGFNVIEAGQTLFLMRPDHPHNRRQLSVAEYQNIAQQRQLELTQNIIFIAQPEIHNILITSSNHQAVTEKLTHLCDTVFSNAARFGYDITAEVDNRIQYSLELLSQASTPAAFTFHLATIEHLLHDVQEQTALKAQVKPPLLDRSPELLARFVKQYFEHLNPIQQVKQLAQSFSFIVQTARFVCDITLGKFYLSEEAYQQRFNLFGDVLDVLCNLDQLEAEQVVDIVAQLAADMTFGMGVAKVITYLKEIDALSKMQHQAARVAKRLNYAIDAALAEEPVLITTEGIAVQAPKAAEELALLQKNLQKVGSSVKEVVKDSKKLLETEGKLLSAQREIVLPKVKTYEQARNKALEIIGNVDPHTGLPYPGKMGVCKNKIIGREWHGDKVIMRLDYDPIKGPHINVTDFRLSKGNQGISVAIPFEGDEATVEALLRSMNNVASLEQAKCALEKTENFKNLERILTTLKNTK